MNKWDSCLFLDFSQGQSQQAALKKSKRSEMVRHNAFLGLT